MGVAAWDTEPDGVRDIPLSLEARGTDALNPVRGERCSTTANVPTPLDPRFPALRPATLSLPHAPLSVDGPPGRSLAPAEDGGRGLPPAIGGLSKTVLTASLAGLSSDKVRRGSHSTGPVVESVVGAGRDGEVPCRGFAVHPSCRPAPTPSTQRTRGMDDSYQGGSP